MSSMLTANSEQASLDSSSLATREQQTGTGPSNIKALLSSRIIQTNHGEDIMMFTMPAPSLGMVRTIMEPGSSKVTDSTVQWSMTD